MDSVSEDVSWSKVASEGFEEKLTELAAARKKRGRPRIYEPSSFQGAPQITVRMPPDLLEWVKSQGGAVFLRRLAEESRMSS